MSKWLRMCRVRVYVCLPGNAILVRTFSGTVLSLLGHWLRWRHFTGRYFKVQFSLTF